MVAFALATSWIVLVSPASGGRPLAGNTISAPYHGAVFYSNATYGTGCASNKTAHTPVLHKATGIGGLRVKASVCASSPQDLSYVEDEIGLTTTLVTYSGVVRVFVNSSFSGTTDLTGSLGNCSLTSSTPGSFCDVSVGTEVETQAYVYDHTSPHVYYSSFGGRVLKAVSQTVKYLGSSGYYNNTTGGLGKYTFKGLVDSVNVSLTMISGHHYTVTWWVLAFVGGSIGYYGFSLSGSQLAGSLSLPVKAGGVDITSIAET